MFDIFFEKHKPDNEAAPSAESVGRINALLRTKLNETALKEEKPMKKSIIKRIMLVAAAAVAAASALIFSVTADNGDDEEYIVRINNKRVDAEVTTYREGNVRFDTVMYELPCELFIDKDGKPVTEDSDVDRRVIEYFVTIYDPDDHDETHIRDPITGVVLKWTDWGFFDDMYHKNALRLPVSHGYSNSNMLIFPVIDEYNYDEDAVKEFWENYWKDPENESQKWAEKYEETYPHYTVKLEDKYRDNEITNDLIYERIVQKYGLDDYYTE